MACSKEVSKDQLQPSYICIHGSNFFQLSVPEWASLIAQLVKNPTAMQETPFDFWVGKIGYPLQYSWASLVVKNPHTLGLKKLIFFLSFILNKIIQLRAPTEYIFFFFFSLAAAKCRPNFDAVMFHEQNSWVYHILLLSPFFFRIF